MLEVAIILTLLTASVQGQWPLLLLAKADREKGDGGVEMGSSVVQELKSD